MPFPKNSFSIRNQLGPENLYLKTLLEKLTRLIQSTNTAFCDKTTTSKLEHIGLISYTQFKIKLWVQISARVVGE